MQAGWLGRIDAGRGAEQSAATFERSTASAVGEESEVSDTHQTAGQNVQQEAAQELMCGNGHELLLAAVGMVSPAEGDAIALKGHEAMVGDGDAVGIASQVVENMFGAAEGRLGVNDPGLLAEFPEEVVERVRRGELLKRAMELEAVLLEKFTKLVAELLAEDFAECLDGQEEAARRVDPSGAIGNKAASGNDVVDMGMMLEVLPPGMEHAEEPYVRAEALGVAGKFE